MYLQITTKCNFTCDHCLFSHGFNRGSHGDYYVIEEAMRFIRDYEGDEHLTIGGGEPTNHPDFFKILRFATKTFYGTWMATNGSNTAAMLRLASILDGEYELEFDQEGDDFYERPDTIVLDEHHRLTVMLSQDEFHSSIDKRILEIWEDREERNSRTRADQIAIFGINRLNRITNVGRAKKNGIGWSSFDGQRECVCSDRFIKPNGDIRFCGCPGSPIIGNVIGGYNSVYEIYSEALYKDDKMEQCDCFHDIPADLKKRMMHENRALQAIRQRMKEAA